MQTKNTGGTIEGGTGTTGIATTIEITGTKGVIIAGASILARPAGHIGDGIEIGKIIETRSLDGHQTKGAATTIRPTLADIDHQI